MESLLPWLIHDLAHQSVVVSHVIRLALIHAAISTSSDDFLNVGVVIEGCGSVQIVGRLVYL